MRLSRVVVVVVVVVVVPALACGAEALRLSTRRCGGAISPRGTLMMTAARRSLLLHTLGGSSVVALTGGVLLAEAAPLARVEGAEVPTTVQTPSGLKYQDFKVGAGTEPKRGQRVVVDYVMSTSGARYGAKIESTRDNDEPFGFTLGDDKIIAGLNEAVATMRPGGIRRVFVPAALGYTANTLMPQPKDFGAYQRWKNIYANPNRPYQPDLILDVKLFGGNRAASEATAASAPPAK